MELEQFVRSAAAQDTDKGFGLQNKKTLSVEVDDDVFLKAGSMVGYEGDVSFTGVSSAEGGLGGFIKEKVSSEGTPVMKAEGSGTVHLADDGKKVQVIHLDDGEGISVNGNDVLAFESRVDYEISTVSGFGSAMAGGLTNVFLTGPGYVAITTHGDPLVLQPPVHTDPTATVAWSSNLSPSTTVDTSLKDMVGQSSGETYQMEFSEDTGFVVIQPFEERPNTNSNQ